MCPDVIASALSHEAVEGMERLDPAVDVARFSPGCGGAEMRSRLVRGADVPVVVCVGRMVPRKGRDTLVRTWPQVLATVHDALLLVVGEGRYRYRVEQLAESLGVARSVLFTGGVPWEDIPAFVDAANVSVMPSRSRRAGLEAEALGIVALAAAACGLPMIVGRSGGAPETVVEGQAGIVVDPTDVAPLSDRLVDLPQAPADAVLMGKRGRERMAAEWTWPASSEVLAAMLGGKRPRQHGRST